MLGYFTSAGVIAGLLLWTFFVGNGLSNLISSGLSFIKPVDPALSASQPILAIILNGVWGGFNAGLTLIIPFVIPFYLLLALVENSGILTRVAFMMDSAMHKMGLHGKALIPIILGYGCSVPAIQACKIMETRRERLLAAFAITFAPCSARTIVLFGMVGLFVGIQWALLLYVVDIAIIFALGRIAMKAVPGQIHGVDYGDEQLQNALDESGVEANLDPNQIHHLPGFPHLHRWQRSRPSTLLLQRVDARWQCVVAVDGYVAGVACCRGNSADSGCGAQRIRSAWRGRNLWHYQLGTVLLVRAAGGDGVGRDALHPLHINDCYSGKRIRVESHSSNNVS